MVTMHKHINLQSKENIKEHNTKFEEAARKYMYMYADVSCAMMKVLKKTSFSMATKSVACMFYLNES